MRKKITILMLVALLVTCLALPAAAANNPAIALSRTAVSGGKCTVTLAFKDIPQGNPVRYAQILLTSRSSQCDIVKDSLSMKVSGEMQVTKQYNTTADSLLVLIEPSEYSFSGIGTGNVFTFTVKSTSTTVNPSFDLSAILILEDGTEKEINQNISVTVPDPCAGGHNYVNGSCSRCGAADPNYKPTTSSSSTTKPSTSSTTKPSTSSSTQPSTSSSNTTKPSSSSTQPSTSSSTTSQKPSTSSQTTPSTPSRPTVTTSSRQTISRTTRPTQSTTLNNQNGANNNTANNPGENTESGLDTSVILLIVVCVLAVAAGGFCMYLLLSKKK